MLAVVQEDPKFCWWLYEVLKQFTSILKALKMFIPFNWIISVLWIYLKKIILSIEKIHKDVYCGFFFFFCFLGPHPQHMEVTRLGVESEMQLQACGTATTTQDLSLIFELYHSSQQRRILHPLTGIEPTSSWILVGFVTTEPRQELPIVAFFMIARNWKQPQTQGPILSVSISNRVCCAPKRSKNKEE